MVFAALLIAAALLVGGDASARELRAADIHPADYPTVQALAHMGALIAERSNGRYTLKVFHSRQLGEETETIDQARAGVVDLIRVNLTPFNALVPETTVTSLPFLFRSVEHMHKVMDGPIGDEILKSFERHGFVGLAYYDSGARSFYTSRRPVTTPADLRGLRIRVQDSPLATAMVEAVGAQPVPLPYGQVAVGLRTGVIDGAENNWPSYHDSGHYQGAAYYSLTQHSMAPEVVAMSKKVWDGLPAADQRLIRQAARDSVAVMRRLWQERERRAEDTARQAGVTVIQPDKNAFAEAMRPVHDRLVTEPRLKDLLRRIQGTH
ncbi:MAG: TRAP transporter substrate-binding protein [Pseudomonadota bacterium]